MPSKPLSPGPAPSHAVTIIFCEGLLMKVFRLYVRNGDQWEMVCTVEAPDRESAKREAILLLKPDDRKKPLRLVEDENTVSS